MTPIFYHGRDLVEWSDGTITVCWVQRPGDRFPREIMPPGFVQVDEVTQDLHKLGHVGVKRVITLDPLWN